MKIAIGCDPNAGALKHILIKHVSALGHEVTDFGSDDLVYANVAIKVGEAVAQGRYHRGILICGTGIGVSIAANKVQGVTCALVTNIYQAQRAQLSNNARVMALGSQVTGAELAKALVTEYLSNEFNSNSRSTIKIARIDEYEKRRE